MAIKSLQGAPEGFHGVVRLGFPGIIIFQNGIFYEVVPFFPRQSHIIELNLVEIECNLNQIQSNLTGSISATELGENFYQDITRCGFVAKKHVQSAVNR